MKGPRLLDVEMESLRVSHPEDFCLALAEETATSWEPWHRAPRALPAVKTCVKKEVFCLTLCRKLVFWPDFSSPENLWLLSPLYHSLNGDDGEARAIPLRSREDTEPLCTKCWETESPLQSLRIMASRKWDKGLPGSLRLHTAAASPAGTRTTAEKVQKSP